MNLLKPTIALVTTLVIVACAGPAPKEAILDPETSKDIQIAAVVVDTSLLGPLTKGRPVPVSKVQTILEITARQVLVEHQDDIRDADIHIELTSVDIISGGRAIVIGGESIMKGSFILLDSKTGKTLIPPTRIEAGGGGWVLGGLAAAATLDDPDVEIRELSLEFARRIRTALFGVGI